MGQRDEKYVLSGIVEMDDGYVGGASHSGKRGRGTDKAKIVVALSITENGAVLFTRMQVVEDVTSKTLQQVVDEAVAPGSKIECDGYRFNRRKTGDRSSCAWQELSLHLVPSCIKPISKKIKKENK